MVAEESFKKIMNKLSLLLLFAISCAFTNCTQVTPPVATTKAEVLQQIPIFKLYPTSNMWTFIKLDTRSGRMWQVQFSVKGDEYRFETPLNLKSLTTDIATSGRFELYPTQNMYNFILLDSRDGRTWQIQWSIEPGNQAIIPIKQISNNL